MRHVDETAKCGCDEWRQEKRMENRRKKRIKMIETASER